MVNLEKSCDFRPSLCGTIANGATAVGAPIDTQGFGSILAVLIMGAVSGTNGNTAFLDVKVQESASATGTGSDWADIGTGQVNGTLAFTQLSQIVGTNEVLGCGSKYEIVSDGTRLRYIRAHATCSGTDSASPKYAVGFLLGNPVDTVSYITSPTSQATGNTQFTLGK